MFCEILVAIGIATAMCEVPVTPDEAAIELRGMQEEMQRQERQADEKLNRLYGGHGECPECGPKRLDPKTLTRGNPS